VEDHPAVRRPSALRVQGLPATRAVPDAEIFRLPKMVLKPVGKRDAPEREAIFPLSFMRAPLQQGCSPSS